MSKGPSVGTPTTYAPPAPPTAANAAAVQASADAQQKALEKKGISSTILGGQAASALGASMPGGSFMPNNGQKNTLLGGG